MGLLLLWLQMYEVGCKYQHLALTWLFSPYHFTCATNSFLKWSWKKLYSMYSVKSCLSVMNAFMSHASWWMSISYHINSVYSVHLILSCRHAMYSMWIYVTQPNHQLYNNHYEALIRLYMGAICQGWIVNVLNKSPQMFAWQWKTYV